MRDVKHLIVTMHTLSVQILKYSSLRFGCSLAMNCAGCLCIEGYLIIVVFSYSQLLIRFPLCPKEAKVELFQHLGIFETHIATFPQGR